MKKVIASFFTKRPSLIFCVAMDIIGMASFIFPALGEWSDLMWAPLSAYIFYQSFGSIGGILGGGFSFLEEIIPFTDIIPTFTIAWYIQHKLLTPEQSMSNDVKIEDAEVIDII